MPRGPKIQPWVRQLIVRQAIKDIDIPRIEVAQNIRRLLEGMRADVPTASTILRLISWARQKAPKPDDLWSIGASLQYGIPMEATGDLLEIWKRCIVLGRKFTVREAKWAATLRSAIDFTELLRYAAVYALEEKAADTVSMSMNTTELDLYLCFPENTPMEIKVRQEARNMGLLPQPQWLSPPLKQHEQSSLEQIWVSPALNMEGPVSKTIELHLGLIINHTEEISQDADMLYAMWLRKLSEVPGWDELSPKSKEELVRSLRAEVAAASNAAEGSAPWINRIGPITIWQPSESILQRAGFSTEAEKEMKKPRRRK